MARLLEILIVGLLHLVNGKAAPAPLSNAKIDGIQIPVLDNRFNLDDRRQNWGILINGSIYTESDGVNYNRPITIPRLTSSNPLLLGENINKKPRTDSKPNVSVPFKSKLFVEKPSQFNGGLKVTYNEPRKTPLQCDIARSKCCLDSSDLNNCFKANECSKLDNNTNLCDPKILQESIKRILNLF